MLIVTMLTVAIAFVPYGDLRRIEEHVADARRMVHRQKGLIIRLRAAGVNTWDAQKILWLLESNLRRFEEHRDRLKKARSPGGRQPV
jgi:hypothetical protein